MQIAKFEIAALTAIIILMSLSHLGFSLLTGDYIIRSSGSIRPSATPPLHTEGRYLKDPDGNIVILRGVWKVEFSDDPTGWWTPPGNHYLYGPEDGAGVWTEEAVRAHLQNMRDWGMNSFATLIWGDWWVENTNTWAGYTANMRYREAIKATLSLAQEYGIYVQLRMWAPDYEEGKVEYPIPNGPYTHSGSLFPDADAFANFWADVAQELSAYPNVILGLYDEPISPMQDWLDLASLTINRIRSRGLDTIIMVHYMWCEGNEWMLEWKNQGLPMDNVIFSNHIYRWHGTFENRENPPDSWRACDDIDYVRDQLANFRHYQDALNAGIPIGPITTGAFRAWSTGQNDAEYNAMVNVLAVMNEWQIGYWVLEYGKTSTDWNIRGYPLDETEIAPPNRLGQALIDAIAAGKAQETLGD